MKLCRANTSTISSDEEVRRFAENREKYLSDYTSNMNASFGKGLKQGIEKGIEQGQKESIINMIRNLLAKGSELSFIADITGLTVEEVKQMMDDNGIE